VTFTEGTATALPYADAVFERVVSSLALHHLRCEDKQRALCETWRVLRPAGALYLLDFGQPHTAFTRTVSLVLRQFEQVADNIAGLLPVLMERAGFVRVATLAQYTTVFGAVSLYRGEKPGPPLPGSGV
jgi:ubiquinone/menaquinone biosynthesis C-methylase UbiE